MVESTQHKLDRVRPPRVQITYDVEIGNAIEKKELLGKRVDDTIMLSGSNYKIVAISKDEVVVSDPDTKKRFLIPTLSAR